MTSLKGSSHSDKVDEVIDLCSEEDVDNGGTIYLYKLTVNKNGKVYIGQTVDMTKRLNGHASKPPKKMAIDVKSRGKSFKNEVTMIKLGQTVGQKEADDMEEMFIKEYSSIKNGYNNAKRRICKSIFATRRLQKHYKR